MNTTCINTTLTVGFILHINAFQVIKMKKRILHFQTWQSQDASLAHYKYFIAQG